MSNTVNDLAYCVFGECDKCSHNEESFCRENLNQEVLNYIDEQNTEIKKLREVIANITKNAIEIEKLLCEEIAEAGVLAIKEFIEKLEEIDEGEHESWIEVRQEKFDNLVKEMMGEG